MFVLFELRTGDTAEDLIVRIFDTAQVTPEAILVEPFSRRGIPQAAGIGGDLIRE